MTIFVTGATGLLGNNLTRALVRQGHSVCVLARNPEKANRLLGDLNVEVVAGDMEDVDAFAPALDGCDVLMHAAAFFRESFQPGDHEDVLHRINVEGTVQILEAAERHGVGKAIYVSSSGVIGMKPDGAPGDESTPPSLEAGRNLYFKSKVQAEDAVFDFIGRSRLPVVLMLPGWMHGPYDAAPTSAGQIVMDLVQGTMPGTFNGGASVADARDVADAMVSAIEHGQSGHRYLVAGPYTSLHDIARTLERVTGASITKRRLPGAMIAMAAVVEETIAQWTGRPATISRSGVGIMRARLAHDSSKAERELGARFRPLDDTLHDVVAWYIAQSRLDPVPKIGPEAWTAQAA